MDKAQKATNTSSASNAERSDKIDLRSTVQRKSCELLMMQNYSVRTTSVLRQRKLT